MRSPPFLLLVGTLALIGTTPSIGAPLCKPDLAVKQYQFSQPRAAQRVWTARIAVDASRCATASGPFNVDFVRLKENAPDLRFTQQFKWKPGQVEASTDFALDEFVLDFSIGDVAACPCRE
jgi:hypothetical protein